MDKPRKIHKPCLYDQANIFSLLNFIWLVPLFNIGFKRPIEYEDLGDHCKADDPEIAAKMLER